MKKTYFTITLLIVILSSCTSTSEKKCDCHPKKHIDFLYPLPKLKSFFDLNEAIKCAQICDKPLLIEFIAHGSSNRKMEEMISDSEKIIELINRNYLFVMLYVDDKTDLESKSWIITNNNDTLKTIGKTNLYYQISMFSNNAQPYFAIIDQEKNILVNPINYNPDENVFKKFLEEGLIKKTL